MNITAKEYQEKVLDLDTYYNINPKSEVLVYLAGLVEEVGELVEVVSANIEFSLDDISQLNLLDELVDFIILANKIGDLKRIFRGDNSSDRLHEIKNSISISPDTKLKITKESGDVEAYKVLLCNLFGIGLEETLTTNLAKIEARKLKGTLKGKGDDR